MPYKGTKHSKSAIDKIKKARAQQSPPRPKGFTHSVDTKLKMSKSAIGRVPYWIKGKPLSKEHKIKIGLSNSKPSFSTRGVKNHKWKGDRVGYRALHAWVIRSLGKAQKCEFCGKVKTTPKSIHWANKSHQYMRSLQDWIQLCVSCHKKYDNALH